MEKFGDYKFRILEFNTLKNNWYYEIMNDNETVLRCSKESFEDKFSARFAAIGHISLLEQGKG